MGQGPGGYVSQINRIEDSDGEPYYSWSKLRLSSAFTITENREGGYITLALSANVGVQSIAVTAPLTSTGGSNPMMAINPASGLTRGTQSIAHYNLLDQAAAIATPSTLLVRQASGGAVANFVAPLDPDSFATIPGSGFVRVEEGTDAVSTVIGGNDATLLRSGLSNDMAIGDTGRFDEVRIEAKTAGTIVLKFGATSAAVIELDGNGISVSVNGQAVLRLDEGGGAPRIGFLGASPLNQQAVAIDTGHIADGAAATAVQDVCNALNNTGLFNFTFV